MSPSSPGRRTKFAVAVLGAAAIAVAGLALRRPILEEWSIRMLKDPSLEKRRAAADTLARLKSRRAVPHLLEAAGEEIRRSDPNLETALKLSEQVRIGLGPSIAVGDAIKALCQIGDLNCILTKEAVQLAGDAPEISLPSSPSGARPAWKVLNEILDASPGDLVYRIEGVAVVLRPRAHPAPPRVKRENWPVAALARIGDRAVPGLVGGLEDPRPLVRLAAASALEEIGAEARPAVPGLIRILEGDDFILRAPAARALGSIGSRSAIPALERAAAGRDLEASLAAGEARRTIR